MHDSGISFSKLEQITERSQKSLRDYATLMKKGEQSLIRGVEKGIIPVAFAMRVAQSDDDILVPALVAQIETTVGLGNST